MTRTSFRRLCTAALLGTVFPAVHALDYQPDGVALQYGLARHGARMAGVGLVWDWEFERMRKVAELTAHTELMLNQWRGSDAGGGHPSITQVVVLPSLRMQLARGTSPTFFEVGIGASWMDGLTGTPQKRFSTHWNFYDMLGVGHTLGGVGGHHELGLRWVHVSNAGLKRPNPGQDFLQLRYMMRF